MTLRLNDDFRDLLVELGEAGARFLVVGGYAVGAHGAERATKDLDVFVGTDPDNAARVVAALAAFGAPLAAHGVTPADFSTPQSVYQLGVPPNRIDVLTSISGVSFAEAWERRTESTIDGIAIPVISLSDLIQNKRAAGRPADLADVDLLRRLGLDEG